MLIKGCNNLVLNTRFLEYFSCWVWVESEGAQDFG